MYLSCIYSANGSAVYYYAIVAYSTNIMYYVLFLIVINRVFASECECHEETIKNEQEKKSIGRRTKQWYTR